MLLISREVGESLVLAESTVVTVAVVGDDFVDLGLSDLSGRRLGVVTLRKETKTLLVHGVQGIFIKAVGQRVRLGFEYPPGISLRRPELPFGGDDP